MVKSYNLTFDYVLHRMSFANIRMYNAVIPTYSSTKDNDKEKKIENAINGDDPDNKHAISKAIYDIDEDE